MRLILFLLASAFIFGRLELKAQPSQADQGNNIQKTLNDSSALFKGGQTDDQAESKLQVLNTTPRDSAQWHMECAFNLLRVAFACKENRDIKTAQRVAARVLLHLDQAEKLSAGDAEALSALYELRGAVREQLLGDSNQAIESYQAALKQKPDNASAKFHLQALQKATQGQ